MAFPYQKHIWVTREVIRREFLQNIEDGIYDEQENRVSVQQSLNAAINDEITRSEAKDNELTRGLSNEVSRAQGVENGLQTSVNEVQSNINTLSANLAEEVTRAKAAESELSSSISDVSDDVYAETTRAQTAEQTLETDLKAYVDEKASSAIHYSGSIPFASLPAPSQSTVGNMYNITDAFTTTSLFIEGAGKSYPAHTNVIIAKVANSYMYDAQAGIIDVTHLITDTDIASTEKAGVMKVDGDTITIDENGVAHSRGGAGGHVILNNGGDSQTQRPKLQFKNATIMDDPTEDATVVMIGTESTNFIGTLEQWNALTDEQKNQFDTTDFLDDFNGYPIDDYPTDNSPNLVRSGGVKFAIDEATKKIGETVNLLPNYGANETINGVTFTVNDDGTIRTSGTASDDIEYLVYSGQFFEKNAVLSGCPSGGSDSTYYLGAFEYSTGWYAKDYGDTEVYANNRDYVVVKIVIAAQTSMSNKVFKPMFVSSSSYYSDYAHYVPYAKNEKELTKEIGFEHASKNLLPDKTFNYTVVEGIHFYHHYDGGIEIYGTTTTSFVTDLFIPKIDLPKGSYRLSGCPPKGNSIGLALRLEDESENYYGEDTGEGYEFTLTSSKTLVVKIKIDHIGWNPQTHNDVFFRPMITLADAPDSSYSGYDPYGKSNRTLTSDIDDLSNVQTQTGAVNLLYVDTTSQVVSGVTFTAFVNGTIKATGTATEDISIEIARMSNFPTGKYNCFGTPINSSPQGYGLVFRMDGDSQPGYYIWGETRTVTKSSSSADVVVYLEVDAGTELSSVEFKPMITSAYQANSEYPFYVPYAPSNSMLHKMINEMFVSETASLTNVSFGAGDSGEFNITFPAPDGYEFFAFTRCDLGVDSLAMSEYTPNGKTVHLRIHNHGTYSTTTVMHFTAAMIKSEYV